MKLLSLLKIFLLISLFLVFASTLTFKVEAGGGQLPPGCEAPFGIPEQCSEPGDYEPDFNCINARFVNPGLECCPNKCVGDTSPVPEEDVYQTFNIFGTSINLDFSDPQTIPTIVNIAISTVLGIISLYVLFRGIYIAAFVRTSTNDPSKIAAVNKELVNLFIGFGLAWGAIFLVQLVANVIGLGSLNNLQVTGTEGAYVITIG